MTDLEKYGARHLPDCNVSSYRRSRKYIADDDGENCDCGLAIAIQEEVIRELLDSAVPLATKEPLKRLCGACSNGDHPNCSGWCLDCWCEDGTKKQELPLGDAELQSLHKE